MWPILMPVSPPRAEGKEGTDAESVEKAQAVVDEIKKAGGDAIAVGGDVCVLPSHSC